MKTLSVEKGGALPPSQPVILPKREEPLLTIQEIDAHIDEMYKMVKTLNEKFARGEISQDIFLKKKTELAEKIGEFQGRKVQLAEKK